MNDKSKKVLIYDTIDCMKLIKKHYPWMPYWIIRRVLFAEELYMYKIGIMKSKPTLDSWFIKLKK